MKSGCKCCNNLVEAKVGFQVDERQRYTSNYDWKTNFVAREVNPH